MEGKILELPRLVKHQIYHKLNVLSQEDFSTLVAYKDNIINQGEGYTIIQEDGTVIVNTELRNKSASEDPKFYDYKSSKEGILNLQFNIENFIKILGKPFNPAFISIQNSLIEIGVKNPRPYSARAYRHNNPNIPWHKHANVFKLKPSNFWITIMYLHPNWDIKYGGALRVGLIESDDILVADCISNSVVMHNGYYGHGVKKVLSGFEGDRDILLVHWAEN